MLIVIILQSMETDILTIIGFSYEYQKGPKQQ